MTADRDPALVLAEALARYRAGDVAGARSTAEAALIGRDDEAPLLAFAGFAAGQLGEPLVAAARLRKALALVPNDRAVRANLAAALIASGDLDEAATVCAAGPDDPKLTRLAAFVHQEQGRLDEAIGAYRRVLAAWPDDWESWNNLGNVHDAAGNMGDAVGAFRQALRRQPGDRTISLNLSAVLTKMEDWPARQAVMRSAARAAPADPKILAELGLAEAAAQDMAAAERAFASAIEAGAGVEAFLELGLLLENRNRLDALRSLLQLAAAKQVEGGEIDFLRAVLLRRERRFDEALALAEAAPATINPVRRWQLLADLFDRTGDTDRAFAAYRAMNEAAKAGSGVAVAEGAGYLSDLDATIAHTNAAEIARWRPLALDPRASPIFIVGFPRSGTTLLDTMLMNLPDLHVLEELPVLRQAEGELGGAERLAALDSSEANRLRGVYFDTLEQLSGAPPGTTIVDKHPLHMARIPLIHRLFPDARIIFVERHPLDVVLSCFMANFQMNRAMVHLADLESAARLYDVAGRAWERAIELLPVRFHRVRYERIVADAEAELRPLLAFLDRPWTPAVLDNRGSAARRDHIRTASYAQVTEPIYTRAAGRWTRYRPHLEPVLPILAPWVERLGYSLD